MPVRKPQAPLPERTKTDDSLQTERKKTDEALKEDSTAVLRDADEVIDHARAVADTVLSAARLKEDEESALARRPGEAGAVAGERAKADRDVRGERATADAVLRIDRRDQSNALTALLVHERATTDAHLLTERSRSDDAVEHRDDFLGMVAHDLRNLLHGMALDLTWLRQALGDDEADPKVLASTRRIQRYVARMNRLIGDLVDVTSIDAGKLLVASVEGDAAALLLEATEAFQPVAFEKGVALLPEVPGGPLLAAFDHERMLQVFANVISNAIKFTPSGGKVTVRVDAAEGMLRFCVGDTGVGIPPASLESVFERFWQAGKNDRRGQGLGLYISKCLVEAHHGRIWAESEATKGTQLYFTLPVSSIPAAGPDVSVQSRKSPKDARSGA